MIKKDMGSRSLLNLEEPVNDYASLLGHPVTKLLNKYLEKVAGSLKDSKWEVLFSIKLWEPEPAFTSIRERISVPAIIDGNRTNLRRAPFFFFFSQVHWEPLNVLQSYVPEFSFTTKRTIIQRVIGWANSSTRREISCFFVYNYCVRSAINLRVKVNNYFWGWIRVIRIEKPIWVRRS